MSRVLGVKSTPECWPEHAGVCGKSKLKAAARAWWLDRLLTARTSSAAVEGSTAAVEGSRSALSAPRNSSAASLAWRLSNLAGRRGAGRSGGGRLDRRHVDERPLVVMVAAVIEAN